MVDYVPIAQFTYAYEYSVLKHLLEQANIPFFFKNETMANITPFYSNALGGIQLFVHPEAVADAKTILEQLDNNAPLHKV